MSRFDQNSAFNGKSKSKTTESGVDAPNNGVVDTNAPSDVVAGQELAADKAMGDVSNEDASSGQPAEGETEERETAADQSGDGGHSSQTSSDDDQQSAMDSDGVKGSTEVVNKPSEQATSQPPETGGASAKQGEKPRHAARVLEPSVIVEMQNNAARHIVITPKGPVKIGLNDKVMTTDRGVVVFGTGFNKAGKGEIKIYAEPKDPRDLKLFYNQMMLIVTCAAAGKPVPVFPWAKAAVVY